MTYKRSFLKSFSKFSLKLSRQEKQHLIILMINPLLKHHAQASQEADEYELTESIRSQFQVIIELIQTMDWNNLKVQTLNKKSPPSIFHKNASGEIETQEKNNEMSVYQIFKVSSEVSKRKSRTLKFSKFVRDQQLQSANRKLQLFNKD